MLELLGFIVILLIVLVKSADLIEDAFVAISEKFNINPFLTGFIILSFTSSLPETSVALNAVVEDAVPLSIGNILGATMVLLTLVIGLNAVKHKSIPFRGFFGRHEVLLALSVILAQVAAVIDKRIAVVEGIILLTLYIVFILYIIFKSTHVDRKIPTRKKKVDPIPVLAIKSAVGVVGLIWSANLLVDRAVQFAGVIHVPQILIGLFMLSLGTNLPEIVLLLRSDGAQKEKLAVGNFIGSATFNTAILGALAVLSPYQIVNFSALVTIIIVLTVTVAVFASLVKDDEITAKEGRLLIFLFVMAALIEIFISRHL
jgi:cation:H+ antiporter